MTAAPLFPADGVETGFDVALEVEADGWDALPEAETLVRRAVAAALLGARAASAADADAPAVPRGPGELSVLLSDDAGVQVLNREYRGKDKPTNVLSFPMEDDWDEGEDDDAPDDQRPPVLLGDLILAYETLVKEAGEQGKPLADHLTHLVIHGVLHLLGYDHIVDADADQMEALETRILAGLGIADPYRDGHILAD